MSNPLTQQQLPGSGIINGAGATQPTAPPLNLKNFQVADKELKLTPEERALYMRHLSNVTGPGGVDNPDGSRSTLYQTTFEQDGKVYVVPTVWGGEIVPPERAIELANEQGIKNFPSYKTEEEAEARYEAMHAFMERDIQEARESK